MKCPHLDLANPDSFKDGIPHDWFAQQREEQPVYWQDDPRTGVGFWVVTRYGLWGPWRGAGSSAACQC
jgi:cholest-4-en-3-one 26-monooxygenase